MLILRRNTRINKNFIFVILIIFLLSCINAIRINEVEINSAEGKEWIELYNEDSEKINLTEWEIWEGVSGSSGPKKIKSFSNETILEAGEFYIIELSNKLNNDGDFVILYDNFHNKIDETLILKEKKGSDKTYQFCDGKFIFREATKGEKNKCEEENSQENEEQNLSNDEDENEIEKNEKPKSSNKLTGLSAGSSQNNHQKNVTLEPIILNSKNIKSKDDTKFSTEKLAFAGVVIFGVVFGALFFLKKRKYKNEFR